MKIKLPVEKLLLFVMFCGCSALMLFVSHKDQERFEEKVRKFDWVIESPTLKVVSDCPPRIVNSTTALVTDKYTNVEYDFFGQFTITKVPEDSHKPQE